MWHQFVPYLWEAQDILGESFYWYKCPRGIKTQASHIYHLTRGQWNLLVSHAEAEAHLWVPSPCWTWSSCTKRLCFADLASCVWWCRSCPRRCPTGNWRTSSSVWTDWAQIRLWSSCPRANPGRSPPRRSGRPLACGDGWAGPKLAGLEESGGCRGSY